MILFVGGLFARQLVGALRATAGAALLAAIAIVDVTRSHAGLNPQVSPRFYEPLPEMAALRLPESGRVFSYGPDESPDFRGLLASGTPGIGLWSFFVNRQLLGPYNNILDGVETAEAKDLTSLVPPPALFTREDYDPTAVGRILSGLRHASVGHVLSLDRLSHPGLRERATVATGAPGLEIHVYQLQGALPRAYLACRTVAARGMDEALAVSFAAGFDPRRDVVLESPDVAAGCRGAP